MQISMYACIVCTYVHTYKCDLNKDLILQLLVFVLGFIDAK